MERKHDRQVAQVEVASTHQGLNIAICGCDFVGHTFPLLNLAEALVKRGHRCTVVVADYAEESWKKKARKVGCATALLKTGKARADMEMNKGGLMPFLYVFKHTLEPTRRLLAELKPDLVVADFFTFAAMEVADELKIPLVINCASPYLTARDFAGLPSPATYRNFGGLSLSFNAFKGLEFAKFMGIQGMDKHCHFCAKHFSKNLVLVNSAWGIEPPEPTYPNFMMTGALLPPAAHLHAQLAAEEPRLHAWMEAPGAKPVVFISTGSLAELHPWQIAALFEGVKKAGLRAVWSLRQNLHESVPDMQDPDFWISHWLPQAAVLHHDSVKAVVYHCGWGGTMEVLQAGKPMVVIPFFGDQPDTAQMLVKAGVAELIGPLPPLTFNIENLWREGAFCGDSVATVLGKVATDPSYAQGAQRISRFGQGTLGAQGAAEVCEKAALRGTAHLVAADVRRLAGGNPFRGAAGLCWAGVAVGLFSTCHAAAAAVGLGGCLAGLRAARRSVDPATVAP